MPFPVLDPDPLRAAGACQPAAAPYEPMSGCRRFWAPGWSPRHVALAGYVQSHRTWFTTLGMTAPTLATQLKADPAWRALGQAIGSPDAVLIREVVSAVLPWWTGVDLDLAVDGTRLACAGDVPAGLALLGVAAVVLVVALAL